MKLHGQVIVKKIVPELEQITFPHCVGEIVAKRLLVLTK
jgi:hypothetical protein